ncbi:hypothetical protein F5X99DRAFT_430699 [Biscogniauxia marginata]|nr:hypothetical protein F5X99DRAFT_430699 [Biscogniauxia marginata]
MLRPRRGQDRPLNDYASASDLAYPNPRSVADKESELAAPENMLKRSGTHNLSRIGYDEEKCRNVLVRYCAHVPRNYQYKDGIQQIFLILREHLGDENIDLAGGVLYELIEVDCEYSDDPGAAFQRWRHDHMSRYVDLELPHIPHMTTITPSIIPTERLTRWRLEHPERYPFVLSDSSPSSQSLSFDPSCIRNRKAWLIDHTLYVSSRNDGTRPVHSPNPKEFHEKQWDSNYGGKGRLVEERDVILTSSDRPSEISPPGTADTPSPNQSRAKRLRHFLSSISIINEVADKLSKRKKEPETKQRRRSWIPSSLIFETGSLFKDKRSGPDTLSIPLPDGCQIPNAIFARKFLLVDDGDVLPPYLPISQMPTAESKAANAVIEAAASGLLEGEHPWSFRGPFTPQLGFDGGLDYRWGLFEPTITVRRFDVDTPVPETLDFCSDNRAENNSINRRQPPKRDGTTFSVESVIETERNGLTHSVACKPKGTSVQRDDRNEVKLQERSASFVQMTPDQRFMERHGFRQRNPLLFENIEFAIPKSSVDIITPTAHRKTTVIERLNEPSPAQIQ